MDMEYVYILMLYKTDIMVLDHGIACQLLH